MAEIQQVVAEFQSLRAELTATQAALQAEQALNVQRAAAFSAESTSAALAAIPQALAGLQESTKALAERSRPILLDLKGIGKPSVFDNSSDGFQRWSKRTSGFIGGAFPGSKALFDWAVEQTSEISTQMVIDEFGDGTTDAIENLDVLMEQLTTVLGQLTEMEANDICERAGNGVEAWRALNRRFDPTTGGRKRNILRQIINPGRATLATLQQSLVKWELLIQRYEAKTGSKLDDDLKVAGLEALVPEDNEIKLYTHMIVNASRMDTYDAASLEIVTVVEARAGTKIMR